MESRPASRTFSPIDELADGYVATIAALSPIAATSMGILGHETELDDFSPAGAARAADAARDVLNRLDSLEPGDDVDRVTAAALRERLGLELELYEAGEPLRDLNNIASPLQSIREVFDLMPQATQADWHAIAARMRAIPKAIDGYCESLRAGAGAGLLPALRQVRLGIEQADDLAATSSFFTDLVDHARHASIPVVQLTELEAAADAARGGYGALAETLRTDIAPLAPAADGVGEERYRLASRYFLGADIDLRETYEWGLGELARLTAEQERVARLIAGPGATVAEAVAALDADESQRIHGTDALREWMQACADDAIAKLNGTHFDIPAPVRTIEACIAPVQTGGIYYTPPSDDFSRPGRMWWAVPEGVTSFGGWREKTTVYHEGVPGHHLQNGQAIYRSDLLNRWRRLAVWCSGHGEGWALYAEALMAELGFMEAPGDYFGMLDAQRMRAARVVFDIGVHLGLECPPAWGGGTWDADKGLAFMLANANMEEPFIRFEVDRYLGWPGQAPSYKVGQRLWEQARDEARARAAAAGKPFDLKSFHMRALDLGSVGLDTLREALAE